MWTATIYFLLAILDALSLKTGSQLYEALLSNVFFGLYQAPTPVPTPQLTMGGITEANYTGYARQALVWNPPFLDAAGPADLAALSMFFQPSGVAVGNTITGAFIATASSGGILLLAAALAQPIALTSPSFGLNASPVIQLPFGINYGTPNIFA